jgi:hypothetical protein
MTDLQIEQYFEDSSLLGCNAVLLGEWFPKSCGVIVPSSLRSTVQEE